MVKRYKQYEIQIDDSEYCNDLDLISYKILDYNDIVISWGHYTSEDIPKKFARNYDEADDYVIRMCMKEIDKYSENVNKLDLAYTHSKINTMAKSIDVLTGALIIHHNKESYTVGDDMAQQIVEDIKSKLNDYMELLDVIVNKHTEIEVNSYED